MEKEDFNQNIRKVQVITLGDPGYSRSSIIANFYSSELEKFSSIKDFNFRYRSILKAKQYPEAVVVLSPSHQLVPVLRRFFKGPVLLDAGWPLSDSSDDENRDFVTNKFLRFKSWIIDLVAFSFSTQIVFESKAQAKHSKRKFLLRQKKISIRYTGFDETRAISLTLVTKKELNLSQTKQMKILFRGKYNSESGLELLAEVSKKLPNWIQLTVLCPNLPTKLEFASNVRVVEEYLKPEELYAEMKLADLIIGQLGSKKRLERTIPHKFFESAFLAKPYLTQRTQSILELVGERDVIFIQSKNPEELSDQIVNELKNTRNLILVSKNIQQVYEKSLGNKELLNQFKSHLDQLVEKSTGETA